jgi:purine-cytosine permease-like protein
VAVGSALGSLTHGILSSWGPRFGVPQMVQGRGAFGFVGNFIPSLLMSVTSGIGWFAVNSVSATFALVTLVHVPFWLALAVVVLLQVIVAFFGHNLVHVWERYAFIPLVIVFALATIAILLRAHLGQGASPKGVGDVAAFSLTAAAAFGYACGWNPYASDYTRYLSPSAGRLRTGLWAALGVFVSCLVLEVMGAALGTVPGTSFAGNPTDQLANSLPAALAGVTLLCIALGGISANVINIYSGAMAFLTLGIRLGARQRRAIVALVFGAVGFVVALIGGQGTVAHSYENFLLLIAYWIAPWLGIVFTDYWLRRGHYGDESIFYDRGHNLWSGAIAFVVATLLSIWLFANQTIYIGVVPMHAPVIGDLTFVVGFVLAAGLYLLGRSLGPRWRGA